MATYIHSCRYCRHFVQLVGIQVWGDAPCPSCGKDGMRRDYRAEGVGMNLGTLKLERERGGTSAVRDMFLPTQKDFESPSDPDGSKGIRNWAETHEPGRDNTKPNYPDIPKRSF